MTGRLVRWNAAKWLAGPGMGLLLLAACSPAPRISFVVTPAGTNVTITPAQPVTVSPGQTATFNVSTQTGYALQMTVGGNCAPGTWTGSSYTTGAVSASCTVAFFATLQMFEVTAAGMNLTTTPASQMVGWGSTATFQVQPASGYTVATTPGGTCPAGTWSGSAYTTGTITAACTVAFTSAQQTYEVTANTDGNETASPEAAQIVPWGGTQSFTVTPYPGFTLSPTVGGSCPAGSWSGATYTTGAVTSNCSVGFAAACTDTAESSLPINATGVETTSCNKFGIQGGWYCYADTFGTSSCNPQDPPFSASSGGMCIAGTTSTTPGAYGAGIGLQLNDKPNQQEQAYDATANMIIGFQVTITGSTGGIGDAGGGVALRLTFTTTATVNGPQPFVELPGAGTYQVLFTDAIVPDNFHVDGGVSSVNPAAVYDVQLNIPATAAVNYAYCLTSVIPIRAGTVMPPTTCSTPTEYGPPVCGPGDLLGNVGAYAVQNNLNGPTTAQCVEALAGGTCGGFTVTYPEALGLDLPDGVPSSYPSIIQGWQAGNFYGEYQTAEQISAIHTIPTAWTFTTPSIGEWDTSYDIWFSPDAAPATANGGTELMIWPYCGGGSQPSGSMVTTKTIDGTVWEVWENPALTVDGATWQYIAYRSSSGIDPTGAVNGNMSFDILDFVDDAIHEGVGLKESSYLLGIQAGFEIWSAPQNATMGTSSFSAAVR